MPSKRASTIRPSPSPSRSRDSSRCRSKTSSVTGAAPMEHGEGERLEAQRRKRFWTILGALFVLGGVAGFATGFLAGFNDAREGGSAGYMTAGTIGVVILVVGAAYGSWKFFQNVDEVEIADQRSPEIVGNFHLIHVLEELPAAIRCA